VAKDETRGFSDVPGAEALANLASGNILGVPIPFVFLLVLSAILWVVLHRSVYGRHLFALGRNEEAARYAGIQTDRLLMSVYVLSGLLAGVAAVFVAFFTNSISPSSHGNSYELYGIAAAVLGGCSLRGGEGSIVGILIGTALLQVLQNLVNLLGIDTSLNFAVMGAVILIGVAADQLYSRRRDKRA
jgi:ribose transport system permease protein